MAAWRQTKTWLLAGAMALCSTWATAAFTTADLQVSGDGLLTLDDASLKAMGLTSVLAATGLRLSVQPA